MKHVVLLISLILEDRKQTSKLNMSSVQMKERTYLMMSPLIHIRAPANILYRANIHI